MGDNKKIFDDFPTVDCNECESWWLNQCDGVREGSQKPCTAFKVVRRVNIPSEIESLRKAVKYLKRVELVLVICMILSMIAIGAMLFG